LKTRALPRIDQIRKPGHRRLMTVTVAAFYKFVTIDAPETLRASVAEACADNGILGTILIAHEGINATVSGSQEAINAFLVWLESDARFDGLAVKMSNAQSDPFKRMKVRVKPEIVTFGVPDIRPAEQAGTYVAPDAWNALIQDPDVVVIDTRNAYEVAIGTFDGAVDPKTDAFSDFPDYVARHLDPALHKRVAMFCTGGIRCEKASAYLLSKGFPEVYHLEGGILKYLETVPEEASLWRGECFVFDGRVALQHGVEEGTHTHCAVCGYPVVKAVSKGVGEVPECASCGARNSGIKA
jgi:UPF0176 protein